MAASPVTRTTRLMLEPGKRQPETTVHAAGRITSATSAALEHAICALIPQFRRVVLDVSNVDYIDGSGFGMLMSVYWKAREARCELEISNPKPRLSNLRSWIESVFKDHEEFLGMTPD
jgi:anti-anti-sigma factor